MTSAQPQLFPNGTKEDYAMPISGAESGPSTKPEGNADENAESLLKELRLEFEKLSRQASDVIERGSNGLYVGMKTSVEHVADEVKREPLVALGLATLLGIVVGLAVTHKATPTQSWTDNARHYAASANDEISELLARARSAASRGTHDATSRMMPTVERFAQNLSQMDVGASIGPSLNKGAAVIKSLWDSVTASRR